MPTPQAFTEENYHDLKNIISLLKFHIIMIKSCFGIKNVISTTTSVRVRTLRAGLLLPLAMTPTQSPPLLVVPNNDLFSYVD